MIKWFVIVFVGVIADLFIFGNLILIAEFFKANKMEGFEQAQVLIKEPLTVLKILFGKMDGTIYQSIHNTYFTPQLHLIFLAFYSYIVYKFVGKKKKAEKYEASDYGSHGTARWAKKSEYQHMMNTDVGFILGQTKKGGVCVHPLNSNLNQIITTFGGSGAGKSAGYSIPNILNNAEKVGESLVMTDPKGELYNKTSKYLESSGYEIICFNLLDPTRSHRYNPLDYVNTTEDAMKLSKQIISSSSGSTPSSGDPMWPLAERALLTAIILFLKKHQPKEVQNLKNVLIFGTRIGKSEDVLDYIFYQLPEDDPARDSYDIFRCAESKTRSGILIGFGVKLQLWIGENIAQLTKESDFDLNQLGQKKTALFLLIPDSDSTFDLIPSMMIDQLFDQLYLQAAKQEGERLKVPVRCILDEFANIAAIRDFERKVSTMRSRGISVVPILQSITQFQNRYDNKRWAEIIASSDTIVFLGTNDQETAKYFSEELGKTTWAINSLSENENSSGAGESKSTNFIERSLLNADEIKKLKHDEVIVFQRGQSPIKLKKYFYFKQPRWKDLELTNWSKTESRKDTPLKRLNIKDFLPPRDKDDEIKDDGIEDVSIEDIQKEDISIEDIQIEEAPKKTQKELQDELEEISFDWANEETAVTVENEDEEVKTENKSWFL